MNPDETHRKYSSIFNNQKPGDEYGRSEIRSEQAWSPLKMKSGEWMQIDIGRRVTVNGIVLQARAKDVTQYVTFFKVKVAGKDCGEKNGWKEVDSGKKFPGPEKAGDDLVEDAFDVPIKGVRCVRIYVESFSGYPAMRAGILVAEPKKVVEAKKLLAKAVAKQKEQLSKQKRTPSISFWGDIRDIR